MPERRFLRYSIALAAIAFAALAYPLYVIRPFRHQGPAELSAALFVTRWRPWLEGAVAIAAAALLVRYWLGRPPLGRRIAAVAGTLLIAGFAALSFVNVYELMFHHNGRPGFSPAAASKLDGAEKVIAVAIGGQARAYPVRSMSYHHVINDVVAGIPVVATY